VRDLRHVERALRGDRAAGERLVAEHYPRVYRLLRNLTGSAEEGEHLAQQVFVNAWQALRAFRGESSLATWLHRIAFRVYTHHLRSRREHAPLQAAESLSDQPAAQTLEAVLLRRALAALSADHRDAFVLHHVQGFSVPEVAELVGVAEGTVKSRLFAARNRLRELLSEREEAVPDGVPTAQPECDAAR
jgi:RNA polymerase sigma-70 factor (ECF subfamily)